MTHLLKYNLCIGFIQTGGRHEGLERFSRGHGPLSYLLGACAGPGGDRYDQPDRGRQYGRGRARSFGKGQPPATGATLSVAVEDRNAGVIRLEHWQPATSG